MATQKMTVGKTTDKTNRKETKSMHNKTYKLDYKEYSRAKQAAYRIMQLHNNTLYNDKTIAYTDKKFLTYKDALDMLMDNTREVIIEITEEHLQEIELEQEAKLYNREKELTKYQEQVDNYFKKIEEAKTKRLAEFITNIKEGTPEQREKELEWFRQLSDIDKETCINRVDNYLYKQLYQDQDIEISITYLENKKGNN